MSSNSDTHVTSEGIVKESCRGVVIVELSSGQTIKTQLSGKMRMNKINVLPGDKVLIKMSPYDTSRGIVYKLIRDKRREAAVVTYEQDEKSNDSRNRYK